MSANANRNSFTMMGAADSLCWKALNFAIRLTAPAIFFSLFLAASGQEISGSPEIVKESGDHLTLGKITVDKQARTIRFPATVNMVDGSLEYLLVTDNGKTHESLFTTSVPPFQMNVAMLLLGVSPTRELTELPPAQLTRESLKTAPELKGDKVDVLVSWMQGAQERKIHAEEWINNRISQAPMTTGPWIYTGSVIVQKQFLAQEEGSIVALVTDPVALINNPRAGHDDDTVWSIRSDKVPKVGTSVEIIFQLHTTKQPVK